MRLFRHLQHGASGQGPRLHVAAFVPATQPLRPWADTLPWATLVEAIEQSVAQRFPKTSPRGRRPGATRVLRALELLKPERGASDEQICHRLRTDCAVMYACGITEVQAHHSPAHFVLPQTVAQLRSRLEAAWMAELWALQAAAAIDEGLGSPAHLLVDTLPAAQGSPRVTDATTRYKAQKTSSSSLPPSPLTGSRKRPPGRAQRQVSTKPSSTSCAVLADNVGARARCSCAWCARPQRLSATSDRPLSPWRRRPRRVCPAPRRSVHRGASP